MDQAQHRKPRALLALSALRPLHWAKNLLVAVPVIAGHRVDAETWSRVGLAFLCFCAAASSGYLVNDALDVGADRTLSYKSNRPLASGDFSQAGALMLSALMASAAIIGAFFLSGAFALLIVVYLAVSFGYSYFLKSKIILDVIVVAALLSLRVMGGSLATHVPPSNWLILFCLFLFFSLSLAKRCSEIVTRANLGATAIPRRGYTIGDLPVLTAMGVSAAFAAVLVLAEYVASPEVKLLYSHVDRLWFAVPFLLYWLSRIFLLANRGELDEDPVVFALSDGVSWGVGCCLAVIFALAL